MEENHYYPYGLSMSGISDKAIKTNYAENKYQYNGKELQHHEFSDGTGLEEYDYGARFQDPQLGRFFTQDRFAEKYNIFSPYQYAANDPIKYIDANGDSIHTVFYDQKGQQVNTIPEQLAKSFSSEYGITLGYNAQTQQLYAADVTDDSEPENAEQATYPAKSQKATDAFAKELGAGHSEGSLIFGYNLRAVDAEGQQAPVEYGLTVYRKTSIIDLGDFDGQKLKYADYNSEHQSEAVPVRSENLARVIEHEFLGHAIAHLSDYPNALNAGPNETKIGNPIRAQIGVPERNSYGRIGGFGDRLEKGFHNYISITDTKALDAVTKTLHFH